MQRQRAALRLQAHGLTHGALARRAGVARSAVQRPLRPFVQGGLGALRRSPWEGRRGAPDDRRAALEDAFRRPPPRSGKGAQRVSEEPTGIRRGPTPVRRCLRRGGRQPRRVAAVPAPPKSTAADHARGRCRFLDAGLGPALADARAGRRDGYFAGGAHFVGAASLGGVGCVARLFVRAASGRRRCHVPGALRAVSPRLARVANRTYRNAASACALPRAVAAAGVGRPAAVVPGNARYQKCAAVQGLAESLGIALRYLPGYSPSLNLIERVWKFVKEEGLRAVYHATYEGFTGALDHCLAGRDTKHQRAMDSLLTHNSQIFDSVPMLAA